MRVAVIVVTMLAVTTPSEASPSCMSKTEARQHFALAHLYWHGPDHCWDATASRHRRVRLQQDRAIPAVRRQNEPKWQDAMSAMLPDDETWKIPRTAPSLEIVRQSNEAFTGTPWADRWVDIDPSQSPLVARPVRVVQLARPPDNEPKSVLIVSSHDVLVLAFIAFVLTLGTVGILYRREL
jgi:hypothetical protein